MTEIFFLMKVDELLFRKKCVLKIVPLQTLPRICQTIVFKGTYILWGNIEILLNWIKAIIIERKFYHVSEILASYEINTVFGCI